MAAFASCNSRTSACHNLTAAADGKLFGALGKAATGADDAAVKPGSDGVDQPAATDAARLYVANHGALHLMMIRQDSRDCAGSRAHAHLD